LGLRRNGLSSFFSFALFHNDYEDFIESRVLIGTDPGTGDLIFQSRNIDQARIYGVDLRYDQNLSAWSQDLDGWMLRLAAYWAQGDNRETDQPLNSIAPPQAVAGLHWTSASGAWDFEVNGTFTAAKSVNDIDESDGARFATPAWAIVDLTAGWHPSDRIELRAGVFNLGNKTYWRWLDVANLPADEPRIALLSRPGRNYSITARFSF
jgi:hemoglobin/transferrin/lactoferrin receptor protein